MKVFPIHAEINDAMTKEFVNFHASLKENVDVFVMIDINSPGGYVHSANAIISIIEEDTRFNWITYCGGMANSAALVILASGWMRYATDRALMMYHGVHGYHSGTHGEVREALEIYEEHIDAVFTNKFIKTTKWTKAQWLKSIQNENKEFWFNASKALKIGVIDHIGVPMPRTRYEL